MTALYVAHLSNDRNSLHVRSAGARSDTRRCKKKTTNQMHLDHHQQQIKMSEQLVCGRGIRVSSTREKGSRSVAEVLVQTLTWQRLRQQLHKHQRQPERQQWHTKKLLLLQLRYAAPQGPMGTVLQLLAIQATDLYSTATMCHGELLHVYSEKCLCKQQQISGVCKCNLTTTSIGSCTTSPGLHAVCTLVASRNATQR